MKFWKWLGIILAIILIIGVIFFELTPTGRSIWNQYRFTMHKTDEITYEQRKEVEDTCRAMISSWNFDVLTYKQYKDADTAEKQSWAEQQANPPLTWDELKAMKGKPVWVVEEGYQTWEYWSLVYWMRDDELTLLNENGQTTYSKNEQGTVWQAYKKERQNVQS